MHPPATTLVVKHDSRSMSCTLVPSQMLDDHRFVYQIEGEPTPRYINLPKKLFDPTLVKGIGTIVTITITQAGVVAAEPPALPGGLNGHKL